MIFDSEAYAEGICEHAAGSTIEVLVMDIDATVSVLRTHAEDMSPSDEDEVEEKDLMLRLADDWQSLRDEIVQREKANGEGTFFGNDEDDRYTVEMDQLTGNYTILDGGAEMGTNIQYGTLEEAEEEAFRLNATD